MAEKKVINACEAVPSAQSKNSPVTPSTRSKRHAREGTFEVLPSGKFRARIMVGLRPDGKPDRRSVTARTERELNKKVRELLQRAEGVGLADAKKERESLQNHLARWSDGLGTRVRASTATRYRILIARHIVPKLGQTRLRDLRADVIDAFYAERQRTGLSPTTVRLVHTVLRKSLEDAVDYGYLSTNPAARAKPPRRAEYEAIPPTAEEVGRILRAAETSSDRLAPPSGKPWY